MGLVHGHLRNGFLFVCFSIPQTVLDSQGETEKFRKSEDRVKAEPLILHAEWQHEKPMDLLLSESPGELVPLACGRVELDS